MKLFKKLTIKVEDETMKIEKEITRKNNYVTMQSDHLNFYGLEWTLYHIYVLW